MQGSHKRWDRQIFCLHSPGGEGGSTAEGDSEGGQQGLEVSPGADAYIQVSGVVVVVVVVVVVGVVVVVVVVVVLVEVVVVVVVGMGVGCWGGGGCEVGC